jgi:hypothetical protein
MGARLTRLGRAASFTALGSVVFVASCANDFDSTRSPPPRGTVGEEMYGVFCDRIGAQGLHDDMTGASFTLLCHKGEDGKFADKVDQAKLPEMIEGTLDTDGQPVSLATQLATRARGVARIEALALRRAELIDAINFTLPDIKVAVKDNKNPDLSKSCLPPEKSGERGLHEELADMLARFTPLYNDGTIPESTESLARVMNAFKASPEAQAAYARLDARQGYRPIDIALGTTRPMMAYPHLRDLSNATLRLLSADSNPYDPNPKYDERGNRIPVPGAAYAQLTKLLEITHEELRNAEPDPVQPALAPPVLDPSGRVALSRPRTNPEILQEVAYAQDPAFGLGGPSHFIVKRDTKGYASVARPHGAIPAPFVDKDHDGVADVDLLGRFVTNDGSTPPTPFFAVGSVPSKRDDVGRALTADGLLYDYIDTSHTFAASVLSDLKPLVNGDLGAKHETIMFALSGAHVLFGTRDGSNATKHEYSPDPGRVDDWKLTHPGETPPPSLATQPVVVAYNAFHPETSSFIDLMYALGQLQADKTSDDTLAFARDLIANHPEIVARLAGDALYVKTQIADKHSEAKIPATSVFWDEMIDNTIKIAKEPGLLEDVLKAFANDDTAPLGTILSKYMSYDDRISYDRNDLNGGQFNFTTNDASEMATPVDRTKPAAGANKSGFQRFVQALHDTNGVTACNKDNAIVHAQGIPLFGGLDLPNDSNAIVRLNYGSKMAFKECEVFKIENLAKFYVDSMVGAANLTLRDPFLRDGFLGIGATTVDIMQQSSGINGFWDKPADKKFRPQPRWLDRLVFFDIDNDSPHAGDKNYRTNHFIADLQGNHFGTNVCEERVINDPSPNAADASPDKLVHGLRTCKDGDWFFQRDQDATFIFSNFGFLKAITPLVNAFVSHKREDLFIDLMEIVYRHWQDDKVSAGDCRLGFDANKQPVQCTKDGAVSYEPLVSEMLGSDLIEAVHEVMKTAAAMKVPHCTATDPATHACTTVATIDGIAVLAESTRAAVDPDLAAAAHLKDRAGNVTARRNDGTTIPQVTPLYLVLQALNAIDAQFAAYEVAHPDDNQRRANWKAARSQLVDQFFDIDGQNSAKATFKNAAVPKIAPVIIDVLRAQLNARCPTSFTPPYAPCTWAREETTKRMVDVVKGPTFAAALDLLDAIRKDDDARTQLERLFSYLLDAASTNDALAAVLTSAADAIQAMSDDTNLVPLFKAFAPAAAASLVDAQGHIIQKSLADAQLSFLSRVNGKAFDESGSEVCGKELDPNQVLQVAMQKLVTPMTAPDGKTTQTPLEVIMDVIASVNRAAPGSIDKLAAPDYASIADNVSDFLLNKERGMEQFYEIVRQGTAH